MNRTSFESYFEKNNSNLDPIEGFWSVSGSIKLYFNGELISNQSKSQAKEWAVIKDGNLYKVCDIYGDNPDDQIMEFTPTANPSIYLYKRIKKGEVVKANAVMTSTGLLEYSYETGQEELKTIIKNYETGYTQVREFKWIKTYPTKASFVLKKKGSGSGFAISTSGLIVTCNHVIENAENITVKGINNDFSRSYKANVISIDRNNDIAILQIDDSTFKSINTIPYIIANKSIDVGSSVFALGYPLRSTMGDEIKLTNGIVSSKSGYKGDITTYQITVPVQPGSSGGPVFDENGNIIGIVNAHHLQAENASYAIKSSYLHNLIESLNVAPKLTKINSLAAKSLTEKVKALKNFTYIIETD
jgi:S1-C subfamily serine protease